MSIELKIKSKHLAAESRIIREEERKIARRISKLIRAGARHFVWKGRTELDKRLTAEIIQEYKLREHRRVNVRHEARATHLARAFISGRPYLHVEKSLKADSQSAHVLWSKIRPRIVAMVAKYATNHDVRTNASDYVDAWLRDIPNS